jgi:y4mF family transcriptional regulator
LKALTQFQSHYNVIFKIQLSLIRYNYLYFIINYTLRGIIYSQNPNLYPKGYSMGIAEFVKHKRKLVKLTQPELAEKAGVGLRFIRDLEQGKKTVRLDKVNQVLSLFGYETGTVPKPPLQDE